MIEYFNYTARQLIIAAVNSTALAPECYKFPNWIAKLREILSVFALIKIISGSLLSGSH